VKVYSQKVEYR